MLERLAVLLTELYGQQTPVIAGLHVSQLAPDLSAIASAMSGSSFWSRCRRLLREALARVDRDQAGPWVFPSSHYRGRPMTSKGLTALLGRIGFPAGVARGAGLVNMLRTVEYPLLARMFGLSLQAVSKWAALVESPSWDHYVAMRHMQDRHEPTRATIADRVFSHYRSDELAGELGPTSPAPARAPLPEGDFEARFTIRRVQAA